MGAPIRIAVASLSLSAVAFVGILVREGYSDRAIIPVPGDVPTIGFGTTVGVKLGDRTSPVPAAQRALRDVTRFEGALKRCVRVPLSPAEFDLYTHMTYNIGAEAFCNSTMAGRLNTRDYRGACEAILLWKRFRGFDCSTPGNKVCSGLWKDRLQTHARCIEAQEVAG